MSNTYRPWPNGLTQPGIGDPLDRPELQRDSARILLDQVLSLIDQHCDCGAAHVIHAALDERGRR